MYRAKLTVLGLAIGLGLFMSRPWQMVTEAQSSVWFRSDFNTPGPNGYYSFEWAWPENGNYVRTHMSTGGWNGSGAAHVRLLAGRTQYNLGWNVTPLGRTFTMGDGVYIRFRIRYDDNYRWTGDSGVENKFILMGTTGTSPNSRIIIHSHAPHESRGCTLGMRDWSASGSPVYSWARTSYFGVPQANWTDSAIAGLYGSIAPHVNISWHCAPPALVTHGNRSNPPAPGPNSTAPVNGWYHFQIYAQSGAPGQGAFKMWVNNNTFGSPTSQQIGLAEGLGVTGWGSAQIYLGGYMSEAPAQDSGFRIDDFEIGGSYDGTWNPGAPSGGTPPSAPTNVRIVS